jgi:hypothetical protein
MIACVIFPNMTNEHERCDEDFAYRYDFIGSVVHPHRREEGSMHFLQFHHEIRDAKTHQQLKQDLTQECGKWSGE